MRLTTHMHVVSSYIINDYATLARCPVACMLSVVLKADMASRQGIAGSPGGGGYSPYIHSFLTE